MSELEKLSVKHPYYCSDNNYYSSDAGDIYETMTEFLNVFADIDTDMNLCFRFDVIKKENEDGYRAEVFIMQQRKGIFAPYIIHSINEEEAIKFKKYLQKHWQKLKEMWEPLTGEE